MAEPEQHAKCLSFQFKADGKTLQAVFSPTEAEPPPELAQIRELLAGQGLLNLFLFEDALAEVAERCRTSGEPFVLDIGERRDGTVSVDVAPDNMTASITITPAYGGLAVNQDQVLAALKACSVVSGISLGEIKKAVQAGQVQDKPVARGRAPIDGTDTQFEPLLAEMKGRHPHVDEHGIADYRDLGLFATVKVGQPLMRRVLPTPGVPGENVLGWPLPAKPGKDLPFAPGLKGVTVEANDANLLIAAIAGKPVLVQRGAAVEPTLSVRRVDLSTGNVNFHGNVKIAEDVKAGMKVKASGDVVVGGMVDGAEIEAAGDVVVRGGIIGRGEIRDHGGALPSGAAQIRSGGSVSARFIENASVESGNCIVVDELVMQSDLTAINQVVVGKKGAKKGHIIGGLTRATLLVQTIVAGSPAGIATNIEVGVNPMIQGKIDAMDQELEQLEKEKLELERVLAFAKQHPNRIRPEMLEKAERTHDKRQLDIGELMDQRAVLETQLALADNANLVIGQRVYGNVQIRIGNKVRHITDERCGGTFRLTEGDIEFA